MSTRMMTMMMAAEMIRDACRKFVVVAAAVAYVCSDKNAAVDDVDDDGAVDVDVIVVVVVVGVAVDYYAEDIW